MNTVDTYSSTDFGVGNAGSGMVSADPWLKKVGGPDAATLPTSWNRINSTDMIPTKDAQSRGIFYYTQIPEKFEHPHKCRNALGLVGGSEVSNASGNLVDMESELLNITRSQTKCINGQYKPACPLGGGKPCPDVPPPFSFYEWATGQKRTVDTTPRHLPACQFTSYPGTPNPNPFTKETCYTNRF